MAASLIYIKSKCSSRPILSPQLKNKPPTRAKNWSNASSNTKNSKMPRSFSTKNSKSKKTSGPSPTNLSINDEGTEGELVVSLVDLVKVFQQVLERRKEVRASSCNTNNSPSRR